MKARVLFAAATLAGLVASGSRDLQAGPNQCYHRAWEPPTACSICGETCLGGNYKCCTIVVGDN